MWLFAFCLFLLAVPGHLGANLLHLAASLPLPAALEVVDTLWALALADRRTPADAADPFALAWFGAPPPGAAAPDAADSTKTTTCEPAHSVALMSLRLALASPSVLFHTAVDVAAAAAAFAVPPPPAALSLASVATAVVQHLDRMCLARLAASYIRLHSYTSPLDHVALPSSGNSSNGNGDDGDGRRTHSVLNRLPDDDRDHDNGFADDVMSAAEASPDNTDVEGAAAAAGDSARGSTAGRCNVVGTGQDAVGSVTAAAAGRGVIDADDDDALALDVVSGAAALPYAVGAALPPALAFPYSRSHSRSTHNRNPSNRSVGKLNIAFSDSSLHRDRSGRGSSHHAAVPMYDPAAAAIAMAVAAGQKPVPLVAAVGAAATAAGQPSSSSSHGCMARSPGGAVAAASGMGGAAAAVQGSLGPSSDAGTSMCGTASNPAFASGTTMGLTSYGPSHKYDSYAMTHESAGAAALVEGAAVCPADGEAAGAGRKAHKHKRLPQEPLLHMALPLPESTARELDADDLEYCRTGGGADVIGAETALPLSAVQEAEARGLGMGPPAPSRRTSVEGGGSGGCFQQRRSGDASVRGGTSRGSGGATSGLERVPLAEAGVGVAGRLVAEEEQRQPQPQGGEGRVRGLAKMFKRLFNRKDGQAQPQSL